MVTGNSARLTITLIVDRIASWSRTAGNAIFSEKEEQAMSKKCAHCDGRGWTTMSCCQKNALGEVPMWVRDSVRCCACDGGGETKFDIPFMGK